MAGLWNRINPSGEVVGLPAHLVTSAIHVAAEGTFTISQIRDGLNSYLTNRGGTVLDAAEEADLNAMHSEATTGNAATRIRYIRLIESLGIAVENDIVTSETTWRNTLGI